MKSLDTRQRFLFDDTHIRGEITTLSESFKAIQQRQDYPPVINAILGEFLAAASLLSATLKFKGIVSIQAIGRGTITSIMAECSNNTQMRGIVRGDYQSIGDNENFKTLLGSATLAITIEPEGRERYQGLVPMDKDSLSECLEYYFDQSEQLSTKIKLAADQHTAAGVLIQEMPHSSDDEQARDNWQHLSLLLESLKAEEQLELDHEEQLYRLFHEQQVRLFEPENLQFFCSCSKARTAKMLVSLGADEVNEICQEKGLIEVNCEFCDQHYQFDQSDIDEIFNQPSVH
ncbi:MAG: Hsp33 family molecular chaperone HslO [Porticoccaceae bacterium]|nr:Hsp33 family molecular chaperone HslO [Porticoccaceae bacterium]